ATLIVPEFENRLFPSSITREKLPPVTLIVPLLKASWIVYQVVSASIVRVPELLKSPVRTGSLVIVRAAPAAMVMPWAEMLSLKPTVAGCPLMVLPITAVSFGPGRTSPAQFTGSSQFVPWPVGPPSQEIMAGTARGSSCSRRNRGRGRQIGLV